MADEVGIKECECCRFETMLKRYERDGAPPKRTIDLCELCAGTNTGLKLEYGNFGDQFELMQTMCYIGNAIIKEIRTR